MPSINMRSTALSVKGQGVGSCYEEQVGLMKRKLKSFEVFENTSKKCDIYHYHTVNFSYFLENKFKRKKMASVGYVHFLPDTVDDSLKLPGFARKIFYSYILKFYNGMDFLVTVNPSIIEKIAEYKIDKPRVSCIPNFVSEKNFYAKTKEECLAIREKYKINKNKFLCLGAGQLQTRKGIFDFVETAKKLPDIEFIWAGGFSFGKITDGYEEIKALVANPPKNVTFLGIVDRGEMNDIYNMADCMFLPSFGELFPMTILEALACKKPVLLRDIPVYEQILAGHYLKADNVEGFCARISEIADSSENWEKWSKLSYECSKMYNEDSILKQWEELYKKALELKNNKG